MDGDTFGMNQDGHSSRQAVSEVRRRVSVEVTREERKGCDIAAEGERVRLKETGRGGELVRQ